VNVDPKESGDKGADPGQDGQKVRQNDNGGQDGSQEDRKQSGADLELVKKTSDV
jgi:hypothetical protein